MDRNHKRTRLAEILVRAGYHPRKCLRAVRYPAPRQIRIIAAAVDRHKCHLHDGKTQYSIAVGSGRIETVYNNPSQAHMRITIGEGIAESSVIQDGIGTWSISSSRLDVYYSDHTHRALIFGLAASGPGEDAPLIPMTHTSRIPAPFGWPVPAFLTHPDSAVVPFSVLTTTKIKTN